MATITNMKSVGIRVLKNQLSKYLALVRKGEVILVTDRDEVVAEIKQPSPWNLPATDGDWGALLRLAHEGKVTLAKERQRSEMRSLPPPFKVDLEKVLAEVRADRSAP